MLLLFPILSCTVHWDLLTCRTSTLFLPHSPSSMSDISAQVCFVPQLTWFCLSWSISISILGLGQFNSACSGMSITSCMMPCTADKSHTSHVLQNSSKYDNCWGSCRSVMDSFKAMWLPWMVILQLRCDDPHWHPQDFNTANKVVATACFMLLKWGICRILVLPLFFEHPLVRDKRLPAEALHADWVCCAGSFNEQMMIVDTASACP